ncbi:alpha/beta hydrolase [Rhodococcus fascians]|nr:alpha/beta hydrolase [Rhodococcus fascians]MBY3997811.1 alpha/beta hydrolase [Rhodococcus fascians]MBY4002806.1 alpha/beta hydrolase [Rhodococcus fascians]MBY4006797.1 alpha/beta hydrolase [Rhodococcus fascians]MBY4019404.1 alpha/beta hydrolase [Rhodococcus fascians]
MSLGLALTTTDGVTIRYDDEGSGRPVVLASGFSDQSTTWEFQRVALLSAGCRVVRFDYRGHGRSDAPQHGQRMSRMGLDLAELLAELDLTDVVLVGHSMGVSVGLALFAVDPRAWDRITAFVAIDQSPRIVNDTTWVWGVRGIYEHNVYDAAHFRFEWFDNGIEPPEPAHVNRLLASVTPTWSEFPMDTVRALLVDHLVSDWRDVVPRIPVPTWVVTGRHSPFYPLAGMRWFADNVLHGALSVFEESGHNPHLNEYALFNKQLVEFIANPHSTLDNVKSRSL